MGSKGTEQHVRRRGAGSIGSVAAGEGTSGRDSYINEVDVTGLDQVFDDAHWSSPSEAHPRGHAGSPRSVQEAPGGALPADHRQRFPLHREPRGPSLRQGLHILLRSMHGQVAVDAKPCLLGNRPYLVGLDWAFHRSIGANAQPSQLAGQKPRSRKSLTPPPPPPPRLPARLSITDRLRAQREAPGHEDPIADVHV